jgi:hypothetical protein
MHNHKKKLFESYRRGTLPLNPGKKLSMTVAHDDWCLIYVGRECNCDPDITLVEVTNKNYAEVRANIARDTKEFRQKIRDKIA